MFIAFQNLLTLWINIFHKHSWNFALKKNYNYKLIDLFAGCGGLSLGFENKGFAPIFVNEVNHDALTTYLKKLTCT